jgi:hypothetical protein
MASQMILAAESVVADWTTVGSHCKDSSQPIIKSLGAETESYLSSLKCLVLSDGTALTKGS